MDYPHRKCARCKNIIDNSSNYITLTVDGYQSQVNSQTPYNGPAIHSDNYVYFHRFCYFNYRMSNDNRTI